MREYKFDLFTDYCQFYLQDEKATGIDGDSWGPEASERRLAIEHGTLGVGTARNMDAPVTIAILETEPDVDLAKWDHVVNCSIKIQSGKMVVMGCTDFIDDAARIEMEPNSYRARIYYGNLGAISEDGLDGEDHYRIELWPGDSIAPVVLKAYVEL